MRCLADELDLPTKKPVCKQFLARLRGRLDHNLQSRVEIGQHAPNLNYRMKPFCSSNGHYKISFGVQRTLDFTAVIWNPHQNGRTVMVRLAFTSKSNSSVRIFPSSETIKAQNYLVLLQEEFPVALQDSDCALVHQNNAPSSWRTQQRMLGVWNSGIKLASTIRRPQANRKYLGHIRYTWDIKYQGNSQARCQRSILPMKSSCAGYPLIVL